MLWIEELLALDGQALEAEKMLKSGARWASAACAGVLACALAGCESAPTSDALAPTVAAAPASAASAPASAPQAAASAPPPARSVQNGYAIHWQRPADRPAEDGVEVISKGLFSGVRLVVTASTGLGQAEVRPLRGGWPHEVQLEFRYSAERPFDALEGLSLQVINPAHQAGDPEPPEVPDGFSVWQREGRIWVELPGGWLKGQQGLRFAWVDRYRR